MKDNLYVPTSIDILVDEHKNLAVFPQIPNPKYSDEDFFAIPIGEYTVPPVFPAKEPIELKFPYTIIELANAIENGFMFWDQYEPFTSDTLSFAEYYYKIRGFKKATLGKKLITVNNISAVEKATCVSLPAKGGKYYLAIKTITLSDDCDWKDFAKAVVELVEMDITQDPAYKTFKRRLNV